MPFILPGLLGARDQEWYPRDREWRQGTHELAEVKTLKYNPMMRRVSRDRYQYVVLHHSDS